MRIVILRHGTAEPQGARVDDHERVLVDEGREEARAAAVALGRLGVRPSVILTSPLPRARETAEIAAEGLGAPLEELGELSPGHGRAAVDAARERHPGDCLVLVGHEPDLSDAIRSLTGGRVALAKGGAACVDDGELRWLLRPKALRLIARGDAA